ncbi:MAG: hypothetical protein RIR41_1630 [Pseudomonadota bacterium]|jgi:hypothetical protein
MSDIPVGELYRGPSGIARESTWLTSEDLQHDRDGIVTIEAVVRRDNLTMQGGRTKKVGLSLRFVGKQRELLLNATNRKTLAVMFGTNECAQWFGKRIALFVEQNVRRPDGTYGPAVRIRAKRIEQAEPAPTITEPVQGGDA